MALELEKPRVTEIQVRIDCNGCVQKIKKALHGINGIYDMYIDLPQQKLTIIGWADPEKIMKAIRKTRKIATICSDHSTEPPPPEPDQIQHQQQQKEKPQEPNHQQQTPLENPQQDQPNPAGPPPPQQPDNNNQANFPPPQPDQARVRSGEVHQVIYHHNPPHPPPSQPHDHDHAHDRHRDHDLDHHHRQPHNLLGYGYTGSSSNGSNYWNKYHQSYNSPGSGGGQDRHFPFQPIDPPAPALMHSYNTYRPSSYVTEYHHHQQQNEHPRPATSSGHVQFYCNNNNYGISGNYSNVSYSNSSNGYVERHGPNYYYDQEQVQPMAGQYCYFRNNGSYFGNGGNGGCNNNNGNITSIFSDENPNACRIV